MGGNFVIWYCLYNNANHYLLLNTVLTTKIKNMKEVVFYILGFLFICFTTFGLFGAFDKDKDNPFK